MVARMLWTPPQRAALTNMESCQYRSKCTHVVALDTGLALLSGDKKLRHKASIMRLVRDFGTLRHRFLRLTVRRTPRVRFALIDVSRASWPPNRSRLKGTAPVPGTISMSSSCNGLPRADRGGGILICCSLVQCLKTTCGRPGSASHATLHFMM